MALRATAALGLVIGAVLGIAGSFAPTAPLRALAWGVDGTALIVACALLTVHHVRRGNDLAAAGFLIFAIAVVAVRIFIGDPLTPLSSPLPFFAYPLLAATLVGWAWVHYREAV